MVYGLCFRVIGVELQVWGLGYLGGLGLDFLPPSCFTEMCSGSEAGSSLRLIDFVHHSTLGLRVIKNKKMGFRDQVQGLALHSEVSCLPWDPTVGLRLGPYGGPRVGAFSYARGTPVSRGFMGVEVTFRSALLPLDQRESSLLTIYWSESTLSS